jgi:hypothetical protein
MNWQSWSVPIRGIQYSSETKFTNVFGHFDLVHLIPTNSHTVYMSVVSQQALAYQF